MAKNNSHHYMIVMEWNPLLLSVFDLPSSVRSLCLHPLRVISMPQPEIQENRLIGLFDNSNTELILWAQQERSNELLHKWGGLVSIWTTDKSG